MHETWQRALHEGQHAGSRYALQPPTTASTGTLGARLGHRQGSSVDFLDHREYQLGDDLRRIDWSAYARSDKLTVKLYREEICPHTDIILDGSRSMDLANTRKAEAALGLTAALTTASQNARFTHQLWLGRKHLYKAPNGHAHPNAWHDLAFDDTQGLDACFLQASPAFRPQGIRFLISDLLWMADPLPLLQRLAAGAAATIVIQLLAKTDATPPARGNMRLVDSETGQIKEIFIDANAQKKYEQTLSHQQALWRHACEQVGAILCVMIGEDWLNDPHLEELTQHDILRVV